MVVIKSKKKTVKKPTSPLKAQMSEQAKRKLRSPQNVQPIATVAVS